MSSSVHSSFVTVMLVIIVILGIVISLLANVLLSAARYRHEQPSGEEEDFDGKSGKVAPVKAGAGGGAAAASAIVQATGVTEPVYYLILSILALELFVIIALLYNLRVILRVRGLKIGKLRVRPRIRLASWWARLNAQSPVEEEADLDMGHDYDGIRELDNKLPPWWLYGFYCTIIFACVYLWRYHVSHSAPLPAEEYRIAVREAEEQKAEYLKKSADNVDENSVKQLTSPADLAAGKEVFESTCFACHGKHGEGGVGPNLTDDYWLHGGSIHDVFRTIKYGWPEKGMKSWKDDFAPSKIAQIASYVKSLGGTHPENPKAPQGTLYKP